MQTCTAGYFTVMYSALPRTLVQLILPSQIKKCWTKINYLNLLSLLFYAQFLSSYMLPNSWCSEWCTLLVKYLGIWKWPASWSQHCFSFSHLFTLLCICFSYDIAKTNWKKISLKNKQPNPNKARQLKEMAVQKIKERKKSGFINITSNISCIQHNYVLTHQISTFQVLSCIQF